MSRLVLTLFATLLLFSVVMFVKAEEEANANAGGEQQEAVAEDAGAGNNAPEQQEFPVLYIHKDVSEFNTFPGQSVTVTVTAKNVGTASAYDVVLNDKAPFAESQSKKVDELLPGENITIEYKVTPQSLGHTALPQAEATFSNAKGGAVTKAISNEVREEIRDEKTSQVEVTERGYINVVTPEEYERINSTKWKEYIFYLIIAAIAVVMPYKQSRDLGRQITILIRESKRK